MKTTIAMGTRFEARTREASRNRLKPELHTGEIPEWRASAKKGQSLASLAGKHQLAGRDAGAPSATSEVARSLGRILRPQAAYRWLLPQLAAITPQYIEMTLRGALAGNHVQAWELFDLMLDSWPELSSCTQELTLGVQEKLVMVEPQHDEDEEPTPEAVQRAKVVSAALKKMRPDPCGDENNLNGTIGDLLSGWFLGQVVLEIEWSAPDGEGLNVVDCGGQQIVAPRSTFWVHPVCYAWSMEGKLGLRAELQMGTQGTASLPVLSPGVFTSTSSYQPMPSTIAPFPEHKFLVGVHKAKSGTALGGAMLRCLAWWWCSANFSADWLLNLAQLFGLPFRWANYDPNAPQAVIDGICAMLENMGSNAWAAFPAGTTLELKEAGKVGDRSPQGDLLDRADRYARMVVLGQTLTGNTGTGKGGGLAFGKTEGDVKGSRINAAGKFACDVINEQLVPSVLMLNYGDDGEAPTVRLLDDDEGTLEEAQRDTTLAQGGLKIPSSFLYKKYNIPRPQAEEETIGGATLKPNAQGSEDPPPSDFGAASEDENENEDAEELKAKAGKTNALEDSGRELVVEALVSEFAVINQRLEAIARIDDPELQKKKLAAALDDLARYEKNLSEDPKVGAAMLKVISAAFGNGLAAEGSHLTAKNAKNTETEALMAGDVAGHEFHGNQWTEAVAAESSRLRSEAEGARQKAWAASHANGPEEEMARLHQDAADKFKNAANHARENGARAMARNFNQKAASHRSEARWHGGGKKKAEAEVSVKPNDRVGLMHLAVGNYPNT